MRPPNLRLSAALALVSMLLPLAALGQAIIGTTDGGDTIVVFPSPGTGLPTPTQNVVPGLPAGARPHGVGYYGTDNALVSDFSNSRVYVVQISSASLVDTITTTGTYNGTGSIAIAPSLTRALASGGAANVAVISAPFTAASAVATVALPGTVAGYQTQAIVFNAAGRAFVYHNTGISVLDSPYTSVAFTIPATNGGSGAIAITPDGNKLLVTDLSSGNVRIFTAPYSAASLPDTLAIPGGSTLDGIMAAPNGNDVLLISAASGNLWAIKPPYTSASAVETIPLGAPFGSHEDVGISADSQLAIIAGNGGTTAATAFVQAPFTAAGATIHNVTLAGGRGNGAVRFLPPGLAPGLTISKSGPPTVASGANLTYTITYGNTGTAVASGVIIRDPIPAGTTFVSATGGGTFSAGVVTWNIGTIPAGTSGLTVSFTVNVTAASGTVDNVNYTIEGTGIAPIPGPPVTTDIGGVPPTPTPPGPGAAVVPTLSWPMLALLAGLIAFVAVSLLARRS
jgi:uncharacterized repeat protein (TIGR01451 family)